MCCCLHVCQRGRNVVFHPLQVFILERETQRQELIGVVSHGAAAPDNNRHIFKYESIWNLSSFLISKGRHRRAQTKMLLYTIEWIQLIKARDRQRERDVESDTV